MCGFKLHYQMELIELADGSEDCGCGEGDSHLWGLGSKVCSSALYQDGKEEVGRDIGKHTSSS